MPREPSSSSREHCRKSALRRDGTNRARTTSSSRRIIRLRLGGACRHRHRHRSPFGRRPKPSICFSETSAWDIGRHCIPSNALSGIIVGTTNTAAKKVLLAALTSSWQRTTW
jgi:hypothetical protein